MADIELVVKIPEESYNILKNGYFICPGVRSGKTILQQFCRAIYNGTPLPKGHGKIKDIDEIEWYGCTTAFDCPYKDRECKDCDKAECSKTQVDDIPTIIEADKAESEGNDFKLIHALYSNNDITFTFDRTITRDEFHNFLVEKGFIPTLTEETAPQHERYAEVRGPWDTWLLLKI